MTQSEQIDKAFEVERKIVMEVIDTQLEFAQMMSQKKGITLEESLETYTDLSILDMGLKLPPEVREKNLVKSFLQADNLTGVDWLHWAKNVALKLRSELEGYAESTEGAAEQIGNLRLETGVANKDKSIRYQINEFDNFAELHLPIMAVQKEHGQEQESWVENMQKIARKVVEEAPQTKWILGKSWLINHPNSSLIGFEKVHELKAGEVTKDTPRLENPFKGATYWLQMVDKHGEIKPKYVAEMMNNGKLPYEVGFGRIDVLDFLKRFLPQEMRGQLILKENTPQYLEIMTARKDNREAIVKSWPTFEGLPVKEFLILRAPIFANTLEKIDKLDVIVQIMETYAKQNKLLQELDSSEEIKAIIKDFDQYVSSIQYKNRVVNID